VRTPPHDTTRAETVAAVSVSTTRAHPHSGRNPLHVTDTGPTPHTVDVSTGAVGAGVRGIVLGGPTRSEHIGLGPATVVVIDTDGAIEQVDTLKSAFDGAAATGTSVFDDSFDVALRHPAVMARQLGLDGPSSTCRACRTRDVCGGGCFSHRHHEGSGFLRRPSIVRI